MVLTTSDEGGMVVLPYLKKVGEWWSVPHLMKVGGGGVLTTSDKRCPYHT